MSGCLSLPASPIPGSQIENSMEFGRLCLSTAATVKPVVNSRLTACSTSRAPSGSEPLCDSSTAGFVERLSIILSWLTSTSTNPLVVSALDRSVEHSESNPMVAAVDPLELPEACVCGSTVLLRDQKSVFSADASSAFSYRYGSSLVSSRAQLSASDLLKVPDSACLARLTSRVAVSRISKKKLRGLVSLRSTMLAGEKAAKTSLTLRGSVQKEAQIASEAAMWLRGSARRNRRSARAGFASLGSMAAIGVQIILVGKLQKIQKNALNR
ncbi:hypothetical protein KL911_001248 [Ogataea haglerorum]|uniref:uncharacterized protein n=1 Tax=Ogataea haglerorum TaxID=1937702 RepID=UPI001C89229F|nr:uncharacterized protein KL911_001248 [Ogataea haglerorum]KAG7751276.1 hypothetical protein KL912_000409 [Ogataea haglerorum]KAG7756446.1 hypothetical protein KL911_001248 [Ogataea haglerorum]